LTIAIDKFTLRDTFACYNSLLKTKSLLEQKSRWQMYSISGFQPFFVPPPITCRYFLWRKIRADIFYEGKFVPLFSIKENTCRYFLLKHFQAKVNDNLFCSGSGFRDKTLYSGNCLIEHRCMEQTAYW